jgi:MFS family permease
MPQHDQRNLRRAVLASTVGTALAWYDFILYGMFSGLVFPKAFFPASDPLAVSFLTIGILGVSFAARPLGAALFGHYGDRIGRKATFVTALLLIGIATFLMGLVPTHESIGVGGAAILTFLRLVQGIGMGGEWAGAVLMSMEWTRGRQRRGFIASWPQIGAPGGTLLATLALVASSRLSGDQFLVWGWRVPFFFSVILVAIGLYAALRLPETPVFRKLQAEHKVETAPLLAAITQKPKEIILSVLVRLGEQAPFYVFGTFILAYGMGVVHLERDFLLFAVQVATAASLLTIPLFGYLSDRIGRKKMYMTGAAVVGVFSLVYFPILHTGSEPLVFSAIVFSLIAHAMMFGPQAALIAEAFPGRLRYSGASLGFGLGGAIAAGPAPWIATGLFIQFRSPYPIAFWILGCAVVTLVATAMMPDRAGKDVEQE